MRRLKRCFLKVLSRFKKIFRSNKSKNQFLGLKSLKKIFRSKKIFLGLKSLKNQLLGLKSQINNRQGRFLSAIREKNMRIPKKKKVDKKFRRIEVKYCDFRHF